jgi:2-polyprenyl-3-methyl-5-hydroxy-6-metoxy-1,4-benzoquinol methylase
MVDYDKWYQEENHFGDPYPELVGFFEAYESKGWVLDLGCGQGRDSLFLARLGYKVTAVDISSVGIDQMLKQAKKENLKIEGVLSDIYEFKIDGRYDIILLDSMFHFYKKNREKETVFLERIMHELKRNGILCICVNKSKATEPVLFEIFEKSQIKWDVLENEYIKYPKTNSWYRMLIVKKLS